MRAGFEPAVGDSPGRDVVFEWHDLDLHRFALHDEGIFTIGVMLLVGTHVRKAKLLVELLRLHVAPAHVE